MSVFKRPGSPYFYTNFQVGGRKFLRSTGTNNRREALVIEKRIKQEVVAEQERVGRLGPHRDALRYSVDQMFARYWREHGKHLRWANEVAGYAKRIVAIIGHVKVADLNGVDVAHMVETMRDKGTGNVAINRAIAVLRGAHTRAGARWGCPTVAISWKDLRSKEPKERVRWITREEAARLLSHLPSHCRLIVEWSLYTGLRKAESLSLTWEHVDIASGWVDVLVKGGDWRRVMLSEPAKQVLQMAPKQGRYVFDPTNLRKHYEAALEAAGINNFRFHDLRHTNATWLRREGASLEVVSRSLGHSSIQVTQRYAHVDDQEVLAAANSLLPIVPTNVVRLQRARRPQYVYFITDGQSIKIGRSSDPERRLTMFQVGHPLTLSLLGTVNADRLTEAEAHARFYADRQRGEWFAASATILKEIEALCKAGNHNHDGGSVHRLTKRGPT